MKIYLENLVGAHTEVSRGLLEIIYHNAAITRSMDNKGIWVSVTELSPLAGVEIPGAMNGLRLGINHILEFCPQCNKELHKLFKLPLNKDVPEDWTEVMEMNSSQLVDYLSSTGLARFYFRANTVGTTGTGEFNL